MGLFKADFTRFFAFGFAAGALVVAATTDNPITNSIVHGVVPVAEAAAPR